MLVPLRRNPNLSTTARGSRTHGDTHPTSRNTRAERAAAGPTTPLQRLRSTSRSAGSPHGQKHATGHQKAPDHHPHPVNLPRNVTLSDPDAFSSDGVVDLDEGDHLAVRVRASPSRLRPDEAGSASEARQVDQLDVEVVVTPHTPRTARTRRARGPAGDRDSEPSRPVADSFDVDVGQADEEFARARRIGLQQGLPGRLTLDTNRLAEPLCRGPGPPTRSGRTHAQIRSTCYCPHAQHFTRHGGS